LPNFQLDVEGILQAADAHTKLLFICSPNNPTGNNMLREDVEALLNNFGGLIIIDEAYINYSRQKTFIQELTEYPNLIVMQTLSKAWGLAALRLGVCFAAMDIIDVFNKVKPPYNVNEASQRMATEALQQTTQINDWIVTTVQERERLIAAMQPLDFVQYIYPSDANFVLVKVADANAVYQYLSQNEVVVRNRTNDVNCSNCIRITIGTPQENNQLIALLQSFTA
jgi:histidinol-phosphate aminotransferase